VTTSLDAYRSDREQLVARVKELEAEVERLTGKLAKTQSGPFHWLLQCPECDTTKEDGATVYSNEPEHHIQDLYDHGHLGLTKLRHCNGFWRRLACYFRSAPYDVAGTSASYERWKKPHFHQRCTACGARWVVDAEGWRFG
jgi:hypothetical protein